MPAQSKFEMLLAGKEHQLSSVRHTFFPLIRDGLITGYNLYPELFKESNAAIEINYLHSHLRASDAHFRKLTDCLRESGFVQDKFAINAELVDNKTIKERNADYITNARWENSPRMRYFTLDGQEISLRVAKELNIDVIGEVLQYDMRVCVSSSGHARELVDILKKYTSKYKLDHRGRKIKSPRTGGYLSNRHAIPNSWDVPLIICATKSGKRPELLIDFMPVTEFVVLQNLGSSDVFLSTIVHDSAKTLSKELDKNNLKFSSAKKYALRVFVEDYLCFGKPKN